MATELDPEKFPDVKSITFATPEDAKKMADIFNEIFARIEALEQEVKNIKDVPLISYQGYQDD